MMEARPGGEQAGAGLLTGTAILGERGETRAPDLNRGTLWVAASPSPLLCAVPCVGLVSLIFFFMGCGSTRMSNFLQSPRSIHQGVDFMCQTGPDTGLRCIAI